MTIPKIDQQINNVAYIREEPQPVTVYEVEGVGYVEDPFSQPEGYTIKPISECTEQICWGTQWVGTLSHYVFNDVTGQIVQAISEVADITKYGSYCNVAYLEPYNQEKDTYYIPYIVYRTNEYNLPEGYTTTTKSEQEFLIYNPPCNTDYDACVRDQNNIPKYLINNGGTGFYYNQKYNAKI